MPRRPIVDRDVELKTFASSLEDSTTPGASVLLIQDASGQGKSRLLEHYGSYCRERNIPVAHVDLKSGSLSPIDILRRVQTDLRPLPLPRCSEALQAPRLTPPSLQVSDNKSLGQTTYTMQATVNVAGLSRDEQKQWWAASAQAFLEDLTTQPRSQRGRYALLFDTFEQANPDTQTWITDHMLPMAAPDRVSSLVVVVAGKYVPSPTSDWVHCCNTLPLQPLQLKDWLEYAVLVNSSLTQKQIKQCFSKHATNPLKMAEIIDSFIEQEKPRVVG